MLARISHLLTVVLLCCTGLACAPAGAGEPVKTGSKRDTLLYVRTDPPGAKVLLNGEELGITNGLFRVKPGSGTIFIELEGRKPGQRPVIIRANAVTRVELSLQPQAKGAIELVSNKVGVNFFRHGDSITITEVKSTSPDLKKGDKVIVKGLYTLASEPKASLCLYATATKGSGKSNIHPKQTTDISKGQGAFELHQTLDCDGYLHLTFYSISTGKPFGGLYFGTAKQMEEIKHWDVRSWYTTKPVAARNGGQDKEKIDGARFIAHLPQGTVELLGITKYPPNTQSQWWKPDGSAAKLGPFLPRPTNWSLPPDKKPLAFLLHYKNLPADASHPVHIIEPYSGNWGSVGVLDVDGKKVPKFKMFCAQLDASAHTANLRVGISAGAWETAITQKTDSLGTSSFSQGGHQLTVTFQKAEKTENHANNITHVTLTATGHSGKWKTRLVAIDNDGREHASAIGYRGSNGTAVFRSLPLSSIKEFQFQVRPYNWVEFQNISITSGQKTVVKVISSDDSDINSQDHNLKLDKIKIEKL